MRLKNLLGNLWDGLDRLLISAVIILLAAVWLSARKSDDSRGPDAGAAKNVTRDEMRRVPAKVVEGLRVSSGAARRSRVSGIARSMAASDWDSVPRSLAMDMREQSEGKEYHIRLSLPESVDEGSVRVTASGHTLTLRMRDGGSGAAYMRHVRVPCRVARENGVSSVVSNGLLHVRICAEE